MTKKHYLGISPRGIEEDIVDFTKGFLVGSVQADVDELK